MNCLVTYTSKYGGTKTYAEWIAEALCCDILPTRDVTPAVLQNYDVIIHGGGLYAGGLSGVQTITRNFDMLNGKTLVLFSCGLADPKDPENIAHIEAGVAKALTPEMQEKIRQFHFRSGIDYTHLNPVHKAMMAMLRKALLKKGYDNLRGEDKLLIDTYGHVINYADKSTITPLVDFVRESNISPHSNIHITK